MSNLSKIRSSASSLLNAVQKATSKASGGVFSGKRSQRVVKPGDKFQKTFSKQRHSPVNPESDRVRNQHETLENLERKKAEARARGSKTTHQPSNNIPLPQPHPRQVFAPPPKVSPSSPYHPSNLPVPGKTPPALPKR